MACKPYVTHKAYCIALQLTDVSFVLIAIFNIISTDVIENDSKGLLTKYVWSVLDILRFHGIAKHCFNREREREIWTLRAYLL